MAQETLPKPASRTGRLLSIDALRGFDMFWIVGGEEIFKRGADLTNIPGRDFIHEQLDHVDWEGFHFYDLIFPLFLFLVGVVIPFSLDKLRQSGESNKALYWRIARRTALLFALGLIHNDILKFDFANFRIAGVLQRIALCYGVAALIVMHTNWRGQALAAAAILLGYWALLAFVPAPGSYPGDYAKETNVAGYVDRHYLPGKIMKEYYEFGDNEGILSTIPAVATALLGALAGAWPRSSQPSGRKVLGLTLAGFLCVVLGNVWGHWFPIIKNLWTSSYVLVAGGWSLLLLALFYSIIDVIGWWRWAFFFVVIGSNAILVYLAYHFIEKFTEPWLENYSAGAFVPFASAIGFASAVGIVGLEWLVLLFLYHRRIFLRV